MKPATRFFFVGLCALCAVLFTGCASRIIDSATTKVEIKQGKNKGVAFAFPKELDAKDFLFTVDPRTNVIKLEASAITTSSQGVIDRAGAAQAQAVADLSKTVGSLMSSLLPLLSPQAVRLATARADTVTAAADNGADTPAAPAEVIPASESKLPVVFVPVDPALITATQK